MGDTGSARRKSPPNIHFAGYDERNRALSHGAFQSSCKGHLGALWRLGYAVYLIAHNDKLDAKIIKRLRSSVSFRATYHETQIASAFAVSGFRIKMAEIGRTSASSPEFWASRGPGLRYAVDPLAFYHWITSVYQKYERKALLNQIKDHPKIDEFSKLPTDLLRVRAAREVTKGAIALSGRPGQD